MTKNKLLEEITFGFYPTKNELDMEALINLCDDTSISNALLRGGIRNIEELYEADEERIRNIRTIGEKKLIKIMEIKHILEEHIEEAS